MTDEYNLSMDQARQIKQLIGWFSLKYTNFGLTELFDDLLFRHQQLEAINDSAFELMFDYEKEVMRLYY